MKWMDRLQWWDEIETIERRASRKRLKIVMGSKIKAQNMLMSCVVNWMAKLGLTALRYLTVVIPLVYSSLPPCRHVQMYFSQLLPIDCKSTLGDDPSQSSTSGKPITAVDGNQVASHAQL